jgi:signal transduction histidine kinase
MRAYQTLSDIRQAPALLLRVEIPREITATGATAVRYGLFSTVAAGLLMILVLLMMLQRTVVAPIVRLTEHAVEIGRREDFTRKLELARGDEIGVLSREFDGMMEKLELSRAAVVKAARAAGMSEIATGVLHNVGNVLNSVNVSATLVADRARNSGATDLKRAMDLVRAGAVDLATFLAEDPRGVHLGPLLGSLADQIDSEQRTILGEVRALTSGIEHIKELILSQQDYAGRSGVLESVSLAEQIESAIAMTGRNVAGAEIEIVREYEDLPPLYADRHRLMEILVNLFQNARQSLQSPDVAVRRLSVRLRSSGADRVEIEVADTGVGIPEANLARIFTHGFTTKKTGHGFGLHASANAVNEMGGRLSARSPGAGRGATFTLDLPVRGAETAGVVA